MRKTRGLLPLLVVMPLLCGADLYACGDKFLVLGRGVRYSRAAAHPASILIYMNPASRVPAAAKEVQLEAGLKQAGHKVRTVDDAAALETALSSTKYDLVLADIADSPALEKKVSSRPSKPVVIPVLYKPTGDELSAAEKQYGCALKTPGKSYLAMIDEAMSEKLKAEGKAAKTK